MTTYTTKQGDMWDLIAYEQMGSCDHVDKLMMANSAYLEYFSFPAGTVLNIPEIAAPETSTLPPWKRANP